MTIQQQGMDTQDERLIRLLAAIANGDRQAFSTLYQSTASHLFALCLRIVRQREQAEEALQDAFLQIWYSARDYHHERGKPMTWLAAIVRHRALDLVRRERSLRNRSEALAQNEEPSGPPDPLDVTDYSSRFKAFWACLEKLHEQQKESILLTYYYGYTHSQLAERMKQPLGTVKSWVRRGLQQLRDCLGQ